MVTADALSRAPRSATANDIALEEEAEFFMNITVNCLPATSRKLIEYINAQRTNVVCSKVCSFVQQGWPVKHKIEPSLKLYWKERENFTVTKDNLLLYGNRIVVPACLMKETL